MFTALGVNLLWFNVRTILMFILTVVTMRMLEYDARVQNYIMLCEFIIMLPINFRGLQCGWSSKTCWRTE